MKFHVSAKKTAFNLTLLAIGLASGWYIGKIGDTSGQPIQTDPLRAGGYTYICLEKDGKKTWAAVPKLAIWSLMTKLRVSGFW